MEEASLKSSSENKQIFKILAFSEINFVQFVEDIFLMISKHTIINMIVCFIFFTVLICDSVLLIIQHDTAKPSELQITDIFYYITTFTVEQPTSFEVSVITISSIVILFSFFVVMIVILLLNTNDFPFVRKFYCFLCHYLIPCAFPSLSNGFMITYKFSTSVKLTGVLTFVSHCCFLVILGYIIISTFLSPLIVSHPFCLARPTSIGIFYSYLLFFTSSHISKQKSLIYARFVLSILLFFYFMIQFPYFSRYQNFLIFLFIINEIMCVSIFLFTHSRQQRLLFFLIGFPIVLILVGLLTFVYFPYIHFGLFHKPHALFYFYMHQFDECKNYIETMNIKSLSHDDARLCIMISLHLNCSNTPQLISHYNQNIWYIHEAVFVTISNSMLNTDREPISKRLLEPVTFYEGRINERNEQFWTNVLHSNIYNLPGIASQIGRDRYRLLNYSCFLAQKCPELDRPPDVKRHMSRPFLYQFITNVGLFDVLLFITFWAFLIGHVMVLTSNHHVSHLLKKYFVVHDFSSDFVYVISDLWERNFEGILSFAVPSNKDISWNNIDKKVLANSIKSNLTTHWDTMLDKFSALYTINDTEFFKPLAELETSFFDLLPKLQDYIYTLYLYKDFSDSAPFFPYAEFTSIIQSFDSVYTSIYTIFTELTEHERYITLKYYHTVIIVFSLILGISVICYFFFVRAKTIRFFESFRTMNKQDVLAKCHSQTARSAHKNRFHFFQSLPATTWYLILLVIATLLLAMILAYNHMTDVRNHLLVLTVSNGFSLIQRICIWMVSSITHYEFQEYNVSYFNIYRDSLASCDALTDALNRNSSLNQFHSIIPEKVMQNIGASLISKNIEILSNISEWRELVSTILLNSVNKSAEYKFIPQYYTERFIFFLIITCYIYGWFAYSLLQFAPLYKSEQIEFHKKAKEAGPLIDFRLQKVKEEDYPIDFYLIDGKPSVLFHSKQATQHLPNNHAIDMKEMVKKEIENLKKKKTQNYVELHNGFETIFIVPSYDFSKKDISFNNALVILKQDYQTTFSSDQYKKLFYSIYPSYIDTNTQFPLIIENSLQSQFYIIILKIGGFNQWASKQSLGVVSNYRQILSSRISDKCQEDNFFKLRETSDTLFIAMKHEQKQTARWDLLKSTASFANELMEIAKAINNDFELSNSRIFLVLYKTFEPKTILGNARMELTDFKSDVIFKAEGRTSKSIADMVVYSPEHTEAILTNASKVKTCHTPNGDPYDLWFVV